MNLLQELRPHLSVEAKRHARKAGGVKAVPGPAASTAGCGPNALEFAHSPRSARNGGAASDVLF